MCFLSSVVQLYWTDWFGRSPICKQPLLLCMEMEAKLSLSDWTFTFRPTKSRTGRTGNKKLMRPSLEAQPQYASLPKASSHVWRYRCSRITKKLLIKSLGNWRTGHCDPKDYPSYSSCPCYNLRILYIRCLSSDTEPVVQKWSPKFLIRALPRDQPYFISKIHHTFGEWFCFHLEAKCNVFWGSVILCYLNTVDWDQRNWSTWSHLSCTDQWLR